MGLVDGRRQNCRAWAQKWAQLAECVRRCPETQGRRQRDVAGCLLHCSLLSITQPLTQLLQQLWVVLPSRSQVLLQARRQQGGRMFVLLRVSVARRHRSGQQLLLQAPCSCTLVQRALARRGTSRMPPQPALLHSLVPIPLPPTCANSRASASCPPRISSMSRCCCRWKNSSCCSSRISGSRSFTRSMACGTRDANNSRPS